MKYLAKIFVFAIGVSSLTEKYVGSRKTSICVHLHRNIHGQSVEIFVVDNYAARALFAPNVYRVMNVFDRAISSVKHSLFRYRGRKLLFPVELNQHGIAGTAYLVDS